MATLRPARQMQAVISTIARRHECDLTETGAHLRISSGAYMDLCIENIGPTVGGQPQISVAHYYEQNGDLCPDPEIVFVVFADRWFPIEHTTPQLMIMGRVIGGYQRLVNLNADGWPETWKPRAQRESAVFANKWAANLRHQGFTKAT